MHDFLAALSNTQNSSFAKNEAFTENGALTNSTSSSPLVDLFSSIGALRAQTDSDIISRFRPAFAQDPTLALRIAFYARDVRGGLGERHVFQVIMHDLAYTHPSSVKQNIEHFAEFGRFSDLLCLLDTPLLRDVAFYLHDLYAADLEKLDHGSQNISLVGKWLPSINTSSKATVQQAKLLCSIWGEKESSYRKNLARLRSAIQIIEDKLRKKEYDFDYSKQPGGAMFKYQKAFLRNDRERFISYLDKVDSGEAKLNASTIYPYQIVHRIMDAFVIPAKELWSLEQTWRALPDYTQDKDDAIVVMDGSGSMYGLPIEIAMSLAIYFADHNKGRFKGNFITFSEHPKLVNISCCEDIVNKVHYCEMFNEIANTNLEAVFDLILDTALREHMTQQDIPGKLYIISDMEFDECVEGGNRKTLYQAMSDKYARYGFKLPQVVFWRVDARSKQVPVRSNDVGVTLVSGASPTVFQLVIEGNDSPYTLMMKVLTSERYSNIFA